MTSDDTTETAADGEGPPGVVPVDLRDYARFSTEHACRVRVFATPRIALDLWCLEPRQATPVVHEPGRDVTYTVLGGRALFITDEGDVGLDPLGSMLVPADTVHGIDNRAADPLIVVAVSTPPTAAPVDEPVSAAAAAVHATEPGGLLSRVASAWTRRR